DVLRQHEHADLRMFLANLLRGSQPLVGLRRRHPDIDDGNVGVVATDLEQEVVGGGRLAYDLEPGIAEKAGDPLAQENRVLCDRDAKSALVAHRQSWIIRSAESSSLGTKPRAPLGGTSVPKSPWARVDVSKTAGPRPPSATRLAPSSPSTSGSWTSSKTISGSSSPAAATAVSPSSASPTTSKPSFSSSARATR